MSSPPSPQPPNPVPVYDHDDPMGVVKYRRALEIGVCPRDVTCISNAVDTTPIATLLLSLQYLFGLRMNFGFYFDKIFAGNEEGRERCRVLFEQLGNLGFERGEGVTSITGDDLLGRASLWMDEWDECKACYE